MTDDPAWQSVGFLGGAATAGVAMTFLISVAVQLDDCRKPIAHRLVVSEPDARAVALEMLERACEDYPPERLLVNFHECEISDE